MYMATNNRLHCVIYRKATAFPPPRCVCRAFALSASHTTQHLALCLVVFVSEVWHRGWSESLLVTGRCQSPTLSSQGIFPSAPVDRALFGTLCGQPVSCSCEVAAGCVQIDLRSCFIAAHFLLILLQTVGSRVTFRDHTDRIDGSPLAESDWLLVCSWGASVKHVMRGSAPRRWVMRGRLPSAFAALVFLQVEWPSSVFFKFLFWRTNHRSELDWQRAAVFPLPPTLQQIVFFV